VSGSTLAITREHLLVDDADTPADEIVYSLLTAPTNGDVIVDGVGVTSFTQQMIDDRRVVFAHRPGERDHSASTDRPTRKPRTGFTKYLAIYRKIIASLS